MKKKLVIFDLDGTLINSLEDLADAANQCLKQEGYAPHPLERFPYFVGDGVHMLLVRALTGQTGDLEREALRLRPIFDQYYSRHSADKTQPYPGIREMLDKLRQSGVRLAVASNKPDEFARELTDRFFNGIFDHVQGQTPQVPKKPDPGIIQAILHNLGVNPEDTVLAGDSNVDIFTAKNAGISSIGCLWGFRGREELQQAGAEALAAGPEEIPPLVLGQAE